MLQRSIDVIIMTHKRTSKQAQSVQQIAMSVRMSVSWAFCSYCICRGNVFDRNLKHVAILRCNDVTVHINPLKPELNPICYFWHY